MSQFNTHDPNLQVCSKRELNQLFSHQNKENHLKHLETKLRQFRPLNGALTSFFPQVKFVLKKQNLICHIINNIDKQGDKKDVSNGCNKSQLFALCSMVENFAFTPFLYFLVVPKASFSNSLYHVPKTLFLSFKSKKCPKLL